MSEAARLACRRECGLQALPCPQFSLRSSSNDPARRARERFSVSDATAGGSQRRSAGERAIRHCRTVAQHAAVRAMVAETSVEPRQLILPMFVAEGP